MSIMGHNINTILVALGEKALSSSINGVIAVVVAVPLAAILRKGLKGTAISKELIQP